MADKRPFAVVTGGTNGIGLELAKLFLADGFDILIAGEDDAHSDTVRQQLSEQQGDVQVWKGDLGYEDQVKAFYEVVSYGGRPIDALCVNAGFGLGGAFTDSDLATELQMIDVNIRSAVQLTKLVLEDMVARDSGRILFTSSIAATMPDPFEAVYGGTKVFLRWFGEALHNELKDTDVGVTVLMPGVTNTNFFNRAEMLDTKAGASDKKDDPSMVAKAGYDALMAGKDKVVSGFKNKIMAAIADALPDRVAAQVHRGMSEPGSSG